MVKNLLNILRLLISSVVGDIFVGFELTPMIGMPTLPSPPKTFLDNFHWTRSPFGN